MPEAAAGKVRAAGAVVWRPGPPGDWPGGHVAGPEVALVHRPRYDDWSFPKGKRAHGEHLLITAVREVAEETGMRAVLGRRLRPSCYLADGRPKRVDYWAARPVADGSFLPTQEVDGLVWLPVAAARERLSYPRDVALLEEFASAPAATAPLVLLRHAFAASKNAWREAGNTDDLARPLSPRGRVQARILAEMLSCFPPARVVSSAAERCLATVIPYAAAVGARTEADPALAPPAGPDGAAAHTVGARLAAAGKPVVVCAHRENLPYLIAGMCEVLGSPAPDSLPLRKGEFCVLHVAAGRLVGAERHRAEIV